MSKRILLIVFFLSCILYGNSSTKKPMKEQECVPNIQQECDDSLQNEVTLDMAKFQAKNDKKATPKRVGQTIYTPCLDESYDKPGEYMAGLGVAEGEEDRNSAKINANRNAITDISSRYIGMLMNSLSQYVKKVDNGKQPRIDMDYEGQTKAIGTMLIEKYATNACTSFERDEFGGYTCYVAIHVDIKSIIDATIEEFCATRSDSECQQLKKILQKELND